MTSRATSQAVKARQSRQEAKSDAMRRRLCEAATLRFSRTGYHRTSLNDVVKEAGVSIGALQHHFPNKEALVVATAGYLLARSVRWFERARAGRDTLDRLVKASWREQFKTDEYGALLEILVAARTDEALRRAIAQAMRNWRRSIEKAIARDADSPEEIRAQALLLTISRCMMTGLLVHDELLRDRKRADEVIGYWSESLSRR